MLFREIDKASIRSVALFAISLCTSLTFQHGASAGEQDMSVIAQASSGMLACEIRKVGAGAAVQLTGVVSGSAAVAGNARFVLKKSGPSGTSNINQGNPFDLSAGAEVDVNHVTINLGPEDHAVVEFIVTSSDGIVCRATANLEL